MKPLWMAVGGFILALGIVLIVGGYIAGLNQGIPSPPMGNGTGGLHWYGPNLILFGATISPIGAVILLYGLATKGKRIQPNQNR
jgi:hypothetical protein